MAASYGYTAPNYGYYRPPAQKGPMVQTRALAMAAGQRAAPTPNNPFGIGSTSLGFDVGDGSIVKPPAVTHAAVAPDVAPAAAPATPAPTTPAMSPTAQTAASNASSGFDINTDPQFASANALLTSGPGSSDENLNASALKQRKDIALGYGDEGLARALGGDQLALAAKQNPTSILAQLAQGHDRTIHDLTEGLNQQNLLYSGYRVKQEGAAGQDYQNQLAAAAQAVNGQLGSIDAQLAQALGANTATRIAAMNSAYDRNKTAAGASPADAAAATGDGSVTDPLGGAGNTGADDLRAALALAARTHRMGFV